jgi:hypothetical protein
MSDEAGVLQPGLRLGPSDVRERIGRGGMGEVYRAPASSITNIGAIYGVEQTRDSR